MTLDTIFGSGASRTSASQLAWGRHFVFGWMVALAALSQGCADKAPPDDTMPRGSSVSEDPNIVAVYRGGVVSRLEFDSFQEQESTVDPMVAEVNEADWRVSRITEMVLRKMLEEDVAADDPNPAFQTAVQQSTVGTLLTAVNEELGWGQLPVSSEEVRAQYDSHPEQYVDPKMARLQHIFFRAEDAVLSPADRKRIRQRLEGIRQEILAGADFTQMARQHSESEDAKRDGMMTLKEGARVFPPFAEAVWGLEIEEVSEIVDIPTGFQLLKMKEILPPVHREFEDVLDFARRRAHADKLKATHDDFLREAGERYGLERHYERLSDPFISQDAELVVVGEESYRLRNLTFELPSNLLAHLYAAYFPKVHEFLDEVARNLLLLKEAERLDLSRREEVAQQIEARIREIRYKHGLDRRLRRKVSEVPEAEIQQFFQQNEKRYQTMRRQDVDVIMIKHELDQPFWPTLRRAEDLVRRIRAGEDFADLARTHSIHYSAANGGRIENVTDTALAELIHARPSFRAELRNLPEGEVADPMVAEIYDTDRLRYLRTGVVIARVVEVYPPEQASFGTVKEAVRSNYLRRNYQRLEAEVRKEILESAAVEIYFDNLPPI